MIQVGIYMCIHKKQRQNFERKTRKVNLKQPKKKNKQMKGGTEKDSKNN